MENSGIRIVSGRVSRYLSVNGVFTKGKIRVIYLSPLLTFPPPLQTVIRHPHEKLQFFFLEILKMQFHYTKVEFIFIIKFMQRNMDPTYLNSLYVLYVPMLPWNFPSHGYTLKLFRSRILQQKGQRVFGIVIYRPSLKSIIFPKPNR